MSLEQLGQIKQQVDEELEHLTNSFAQLHSAQVRFKECLRCVRQPGYSASGVLIDMQRLMTPLLTASVDGGSVLVPLTNSLYIRGQLSRPGHVLVDIGTGYFIEKVSDVCLAIILTMLLWHRHLLIHRQDMGSAGQFYESKVRELGNSIQDLEVIMQRKTSNAQSIEEGT